MTESLPTQGVVTQEPARVVDKVAYDTSEHLYRGCHVRASYLKPPHEQDAWIEFFRDSKPIKAFRCPAHLIYNYQAHFTDLIDEYYDNV